MADSIKTGDAVEWQSQQGKIVGVVKKKLTKPMAIKGHKVAATADDPQYLVRSDKTNAQAAHKEEALTKVKASKKD